MTSCNCCLLLPLGALAGALVLCGSVVGNVIDIQPKGILPIALSMPDTFNCTKKLEGQLFGWRLNFTDGSISFIEESKTFDGVNFIVTFFGTDVTVLEIESIESIASIECQFFDSSSGNVIRSSTTDIVIVAPPPTPSNVSVVLVNSWLLVDWAVPTLPHVSLTFKLTLNTSADESVIIRNNQSWQLAIAEQACGPYQLEIEASNIAGSNSTTVTGRIPVLRGAVCHEVYVTDEVSLAVSFTRPKCSSVDNSQLRLEVTESGSGGNSSDVSMASVCTVTTNSDQLECITTLPRDSTFNFAIVSSNGDSTDPVSISTGNIQGASLSPTASNTTYRVTCQFLTGSSAHGCGYTLTDSTNRLNVSGIILRQNGRTASVEIDITDVEEYSELVAYEIDENKETISDSVPFKTSAIFSVLGDSEQCLSQSTRAVSEVGATMASDGSFSFVPVIAGVVGGLVAVVLLAALIIFVVFGFYKRNSKNEFGLRASVDVESSYSPHKFTVNCSSTDDPENATQASDPIYSEVLKKVEVADPIYHVLESNPPDTSYPTYAEVIHMPSGSNYSTVDVS